jgi:demethylphylloquinone reductase
MSATKICIVGGGFGGLYTALRLSEFPWEQENKPEITLIDQSDRRTTEL